MKPKPEAEPIRAVFAKNVKSYRNTLKYSQEKLAEKTGLSVQTIKDIEACRHWVSDKTLTKLAKALKTPEFQLFLPEKYDDDANYRKSLLKNFVSLRESLKASIDEQFEDAINTGDLH
jgi:transcriptional regulator with XRE-family HTH domain